MKININISFILVPPMVETTGINQGTELQGVQILYIYKYIYIYTHTHTNTYTNIYIKNFTCSQKVKIS